MSKYVTTFLNLNTCIDVKEQTDQFQFGTALDICLWITSIVKIVKEMKIIEL